MVPCSSYHFIQLSSRYGTSGYKNQNSAKPLLIPLRIISYNYFSRNLLWIKPLSVPMMTNLMIKVIVRVKLKKQVEKVENMSSDGEAIAAIGAFAFLCCFAISLVIMSPVIAGVDLGVCKAANWECKADFLAPSMPPNTYLTSLVRVLTIPVYIILMIIGLFLMGLGLVIFGIVAIGAMVATILAAILVVLVVTSPVSVPIACFVYFGNEKVDKHQEI